MSYITPHQKPIFYVFFLFKCISTSISISEFIHYYDLRYHTLNVKIPLRKKIYVLHLIHLHSEMAVEWIYKAPNNKYYYYYFIPLVVLYRYMRANRRRKEKYPYVFTLMWMTTSCIIVHKLQGSLMINFEHSRFLYVYISTFCNSTNKQTKKKQQYMNKKRELCVIIIITAVCLPIFTYINFTNIFSLLSCLSVMNILVCICTI